MALAAHRAKWVATAPADRARLLRACIDTTLAVADKWAETARNIKGYAEGSNGHGEEYLAGTLPTVRNLRLYAEALDGWVQAVAFSPAGDRLAVAARSFPARLIVYDVPFG